MSWQLIRDVLPRSKSLLALLFLPLLGSCSYVYEILAVSIDGQLAFVIDPASRYQPDCAFGIHVTADHGEPKAEPEPGDQVGLVENGGAYWWDVKDTRSCENLFPIIYGKRLIGPSADNLGYVKAKPLKRDVVYQVNASGDGANGGGWFKIHPDGRIENYPGDPSPQGRYEQDYPDHQDAPN
ncbi:hypothetical protein [Alteriqipengyuania sp.]|uniref:hypothetical protein n=1 Tax=Alteriqipengyuania sp. TaxID=2800692 RepID=UPI003559EDF6